MHTSSSWCSCKDNCPVFNLSNSTLSTTENMGGALSSSCKRFCKTFNSISVDSAHVKNCSFFSVYIALK